jgi:hypothetical protein
MTSPLNRLAEPSAFLSVVADGEPETARKVLIMFGLPTGVQNPSSNAGLWGSANCKGH